MRRIGLRCSVLFAVLAVEGCRSASSPTTYVHKHGTMPPNTILLSTMLSDLSTEPGFTDQMLNALTAQSKVGAAILSPKLAHTMRVMILGKDWSGLDHFPGWRMQGIDPLIDVYGRLDPTSANAPARPLTDYIDLGSYALDHAQRMDLNKPSKLPGFTTEGLVTPMGYGVVRGDGPNPEIAPMHSESQRLADVLNRLAMNRLEGTAEATAKLGGIEAKSPEELLHALTASGHEVMVADARYFANFGHLHYEGADVMMPFWVNTSAWIPGTDEQLKVPVSHAEYEWFVRGPKINADISFYFGIDGKAEFRTMDTLDQAWVMGRHAHEYKDADALEVTRLTGLLALAYAHAHLAHPRLAFGGYYALGVCQDGVAAIERKMTGATTLFPNTADVKLFADPRDAEINALLVAIPKDRGETPPEMERVFGSLPTRDLTTIPIPGLGANLEVVQRAWRDGTLTHYRRPWWKRTPVLIGAVVGLMVLSGWSIARSVRRRRLRTGVR